MAAGPDEESMLHDDRQKLIPWRLLFSLTCLVAVSAQAEDRGLPCRAGAVDNINITRVRFATFNVALNRPGEGQLAAELARGDSAAAAGLAEVLQRIRPDVLLLNEFDFDPTGQSLADFRRLYLTVSQNGQPPIEYAHSFAEAVNTGVDSGLDLNGDGRTGTAEDAFGFGNFPGQFGMAVLSKYPIGAETRTFRNFLWRDLAETRWPVDPASGRPYFAEQAQSILRLSSKSHWDLPIEFEGRTIHLIAAHPTPPVFDGPEDRNGCRNFDEIRLIAEYIRGVDYIYDDRGVRGGLANGQTFVILGDMNADPHDGDGLPGAVKQLLELPQVDSRTVPLSQGAQEASRIDQGVNQHHLGDPAADTADLADHAAGNLRLDYVLPSTDLTIVGGGVFWPPAGDPAVHLANLSDHHLVWVDVEW